MPKLEWSRLALADQQRIIDYYAAIDPELALQMIDRIDDGVDVLMDYPDAGREGRVTGTREWPLKKTPFVAVYTASRKAVRIQRLLHGAMHWPPEG